MTSTSKKDDQVIYHTQSSMDEENAHSDTGCANDPLAAPLKRRLQSRHLQMIAIGGEQSLGEMATAIPVSGSFTEYAQRFVDDSLAFGLGWAYWYLWVTVLANEYNAISLVIGYWTEAVPQWGWILIFWFLFLTLSNLGVLAYGEMEFWLSLIKVLALIAFFILAICISAGGVGPEKIGFKYWHDPGAFADSINGVARTFVIAGTLYAGTEMVGITAGESANPQKAVPVAIRQVFWRILIFYVGTMFFIGILLPYNDSRLLGSSSDAASSPLTIALTDAGILPAAHLINALIVISVISAGNGSLYVASRTLLFMARNGKAPQFIGRTNAAGVPWVALICSNIFTCIVFLTLSSSAGKIYSALITLSGVATFIVWAVICVAHIRFRQALVVQGDDPAQLPYRATLYPWGTYFALGANIFLIFFQGYTAFLNPFSVDDFVINYILLPVFVMFVLGYKVWHKTKVVKLHEMDIWTGRRQCHSDLHNINGELPMTTNVPGHEGVGRVVQEYVVSPADFVSLIPEGLKPEAVAPLLCAGLTMYGAVNKLHSVCSKGDWVVIMGAGGGLGHLESKRDICINSGAAAFIDFKDDVQQRVRDLTDGIGAHAVIVVVGLESAYEQGVTLLRPVGTLVCVGLPRPDYHIPISPLDCVNSGYHIVGSAVGTENEMQALLRMAAEGSVSTHYEEFSLEQANEITKLCPPRPLPLPRSFFTRACAYTCGSVCYSSSAVSSAQSAGYEKYSSGETVGSNDYPHVYNNYEGFDFPVSGTYYEWPILSSGQIYTGGSPGADRVVFNENDQLAGVITHTGASSNDFVSC
ncbi:amino acid permease-domain-containing protein [Aspergillus ambiguus]|uniref:amino acid permease-domain-containing protein n=1 Tax=Aspergillus ambiguus TaxID=176160 RepID=UPI003CCDE83A